MTDERNRGTSPGHETDDKDKGSFNKGKQQTGHTPGFDDKTKHPEEHS